MTINEILISRNMTKYRLSKLSDIPYATLSDICSGKTAITKCSAETVYRLAKALDVSMEELLASYFENRASFELFKSNVCHKVKELGDIDFLIQTIESDDVHAYYRKKWYPECFYTLAMVDYLSRLHRIPLCEEYGEIRSKKLNSLLYPSSVLTLSAALKSEDVKKKAVQRAIPEFLHFNIVESEIRDVN